MAPLQLAVFSCLAVLVCGQPSMRTKVTSQCYEIFEECTYRFYCDNYFDLDNYRCDRYRPGPSHYNLPCDYLTFDGSSYFKINVTIRNPEPIRNMFQSSVDCTSIIYSIDLSNSGVNHYYSLSQALVNMPNLAVLNLSANAFETVKLYGSADLKSLIEIDYSHNTISTIESSQDQDDDHYVYKKLKKINFSYNYLVTIPDGIFYDFNELQYLDLSHNFIDTLNTLTFEGIKNLKVLKISHNRISEINNSLLRFTKLEHLEMSHNEIKMIKMQDFEKLNHLQILDLSFNSIVTIERYSFNNLVAVSEVLLNDNKLEHFENDIFVTLTNLSKIDLSNNNFKVLQQSLFKDKVLSFFSVKGNHIEGQLLKGIFDGLSNVNEIDLSNQNLNSIESFAFFGLLKLETLLINDNKVRSVATTAFKSLHSLSILDLSNNQISEIILDQEDLVNLRSLSLHNNFLTHITNASFEGLHALQFLDLSNNNISQLASNCFGSLGELVNFQISNNPLSGALEQSTFDGLNSLPSLDISGTMLSVIENGSFHGMVQLNALNISHSAIEILHFKSFANTGAIESIDISFNKLVVFEVDTSDLLKLQTLILNNNLITHVSPSSFRGLSYLSFIYLAHNNISVVDNEAFIDQPNLQSIDLSFNPQAKINVTKIIKTSSMVLSGITDISFKDVTFGTSSVKELVLSSAHIQNITSIEVKKLNTLETLSLSVNNVSKVEVGAFSNMSVLRTLDLSQNKIDFIQPGAFKDCAMLKLLNISHNSLKTIGYGVFRGLTYLEIIDMSFNGIDNLKSERFYEVPQLTELIADNNLIRSVNLEEFIGTTLSVLSIGGNPIPCDMVVNLKNQRHPPFVTITAATLDEHNGENVDGIRCNMEDSRVTKHTLQPNKFVDSDNKILYEIRDAIYNASIFNRGEPKQTENRPNDPNLLNNLTRHIDSTGEHVVKAIANVSNSFEKDTNRTNMFLENILKSITALNVVRKSEPIPIPKDISNSTALNFIALINKMKQDFQDNMSLEKQNILKQMKQNMELTQSEISSMKETINLTENKMASMNQTIYKLNNSPVHDALTKVSKPSPTSETKSFVFMETCVALILVILVVFILYKFYNSGMFIPNAWSQSTRNLRDDENSAL